MLDSMILWRGRRQISQNRIGGAPLGDFLLAALLAVFAVLDVALSGDWRGPLWVNAIVMPLIALSLAWRRTAPTLVLAGVMGGLSVLSLAFGSSETWSSLFLAVVAVYSAASHGRDLLVAGIIVGASTVLITLTDPEIKTFGDAIWSSTLLGLVFLAGLTGSALERRSERLAHRAANFDREQEERAAEAVAEERRRIARELHDIISHSLAVMVLQAGAAEQVLDGQPEKVRQVLESIRVTGQEAIGQMGTLLGLIRSREDHSLQPQPSLADLEVLLAKMRTSGLEVDFEVDGEPRDLPAALELSCYRIIQEGLTNSLKHSGAGGAVLRLRYQPDQFEVEVVDDGGSPAPGPGSQIGLVGVRERVAVFGGEIKVGPRREGGWKLHATFPLVK
jgi:signal transduction histidine kinase